MQRHDVHARVQIPRTRCQYCFIVDGVIRAASDGLFERSELRTKGSVVTAAASALIGGGSGRHHARPPVFGGDGYLLPDGCVGVCERGLCARAVGTQRSNTDHAHVLFSHPTRAQSALACARA